MPRLARSAFATAVVGHAGALVKARTARAEEARPRRRLDSRLARGGRSSSRGWSRLAADAPEEAQAAIIADWSAFDTVDHPAARDLNARFDAAARDEVWSGAARSLGLPIVVQR